MAREVLKGIEEGNLDDAIADLLLEISMEVKFLLTSKRPRLSTVGVLEGAKERDESSWIAFELSGIFKA